MNLMYDFFKTKSLNQKITVEQIKQIRDVQRTKTLDYDFKTII